MCRLAILLGDPDTYHGQSRDIPPDISHKKFPPPRRFPLPPAIRAADSLAMLKNYSKRTFLT